MSCVSVLSVSVEAEAENKVDHASSHGKCVVLFVLPELGRSDQCLYCVKLSCSRIAHPFSPATCTRLRFNVPETFAWQQFPPSGNSFVPDWRPEAD